MNIQIVWSPAERLVEAVVWQTKAQTTVEHALVFLRGRSATFAAQSMQDWQAAVWGKPVPLHHVLEEGDRLEILRPLRVDPKVARRERFQRQGAKAAGLFAKRRAGAKPGY
ncbi:MAG: RnfH family protein [Limnohabitans sp.]